MAEFEGRDLHLIKKALCIAVLAIDQQADGPFKPESDLVDMKALLDALLPGDTELSHYMKSAHLVLGGGPN